MNESESSDEYIPDLRIGRENYEISSGRITLWKQGLAIFKRNPVLGIGEVRG